MKREVTVFGDGGWGTTIAILLCNKGCNVALWGAFPKHIALLKKERINRSFLPGVKIPNKIRLTGRLDDIEKDSLAVLAIPSKYLRGTLTKIASRVGERVISLTKGIEVGTFRRPSEIIEEVLGKRKTAVLSGPSISYEVARNLPTTVVAASNDRNFAKLVQGLFTTKTFRVYTSTDVIGVEAGGALKNIIAIASGISDGMGLGVNTKAAILTRGLVEIIRLGTKLGAKKETFFGLSGLGDLATTCMSGHSRNRFLGEQIGKGKKLKDVLRKTEMVIEGVTTTESIYKLAKKLNVEMPITEKVYEVLYEGKIAKVALLELMKRSLKAEEI